MFSKYLIFRMTTDREYVQPRNCVVVQVNVLYLIISSKNHSNLIQLRKNIHFEIKLFEISKEYNSFSFHLRVNINKNQSLNKGVGTGSSIELIFTYTVQFFTRILMILSVFRNNASGWSYSNFKFLHIPCQKKSQLPYL